MANYFKKNNNHIECNVCSNEKRYVCITKEGCSTCSFTQNPLKIRDTVNKMFKHNV